MSKEIRTLEELDTLDAETLVCGYLAGLQNTPKFDERDPGYWHGFLNGLVDGGHAKASEAQAELARQYVKRGVLG